MAVVVGVDLQGKLLRDHGKAKAQGFLHSVNGLNVFGLLLGLEGHGGGMKASAIIGLAWGLVQKAHQCVKKTFSASLP